jgi:hypothetical protein
MMNQKIDIVLRLKDIRCTHADAAEAAEEILRLRKEIEYLQDQIDLYYENKYQRE